MCRIDMLCVIPTHSFVRVPVWHSAQLQCPSFWSAKVSPGSGCVLTALCKLQLVQSEFLDDRITKDIHIACGQISKTFNVSNE